MDEMHVNEDEVELIHPDIVANILGIELISNFEELGGTTEEPVVMSSISLIARLLHVRPQGSTTNSREDR